MLRRRPLALMLALALAPLPLAVAPAGANGGWSRGVFPVTAFLGYTSHYGTRIGPGGSAQPHNGLDIAAPMGSPIRNWWSGVVSDVFSDGACGTGLIIRSGDYEHIYCHLSGTVNGSWYRSGPLAIHQGQRVRAGEVIAHVGMSGRTTGPHLHWGIRYRGEWLNPGVILKAMVLSRRR
ncbi:M23 family metallopeptidase [Cyanobium sp. Morenito 9A2]|uniref:M23 family metallopeptidase n=1 Tax=Cyanobium sp. Morenito 9A2 TaxID=2823718 RepID=UPI0020CCBB7C|nr:M23 family metallopeptidase [Cyanobium sp. Morenito 9A2]